MPVVINEFEIVVPSAESTPMPAPGSGNAAAPGSGWSAELARKLQEQLRIAVERQQRLWAD